MAGVIDGVIERTGGVLLIPQTVIGKCSVIKDGGRKIFIGILHESSIKMPKGIPLVPFNAGEHTQKIVSAGRIHRQLQEKGTGLSRCIEFEREQQGKTVNQLWPAGIVGRNLFQSGLVIAPRYARTIISLQQFSPAQIKGTVIGVLADGSVKPLGGCGVVFASQQRFGFLTECFGHLRVALQNDAAGAEKNKEKKQVFHGPLKDKKAGEYSGFFKMLTG
jgi:hypothetical protein